MAPVTVAELRDTIEAAHNRLDAALRTLNDDQLTAPMLEAGWSVRDVLAHLTFWEYRLRYGLSHPADTTSPAVPPEFTDVVDEGEAWGETINQRVYAQNRDRSLDEVRHDAATSYAETLAAITALSDDDVFKPSGLSRSIKRDVLDFIAGNTYEHYEEHSEAIERAFPTSA